jgi:hypothetical protein
MGGFHGGVVGHFCGMCTGVEKVFHAVILIGVKNLNCLITKDPSLHSG